MLRVCDGYGRRLGHCAEQFRFADWDKLPKEVRVLRNRTHFVDILNAFHNEDILYYSKRIDIKELPDPFHEGKNLLLDISRFDISDFCGMPMKFLTNLRAVWTMWWGATRSTMWTWCARSPIAAAPIWSGSVSC